MAIIEDVRGEVDLSEHGIEPRSAVHYNPRLGRRVDFVMYSLLRDEVDVLRRAG